MQARCYVGMHVHVRAAMHEHVSSGSDAVPRQARMAAQACAWLRRAVHGFAWLCMALHGCARLRMAECNCAWLLLLERCKRGSACTAAFHLGIGCTCIRRPCSETDTESRRCRFRLQRHLCCS